MQEPTKLFNRNYLTLWTGQFISRLGTQAFLIASLFWVKEVTGSAAVMGTVALLAGLPAVFIGPIGGTLADRYSRRKIIVLSDAIRGLLVLSLAAIVYFRPDQTTLALVWLVVVSVFVSLISSIFGPAISAAIPDLVPKDKVAGANSLGQISARVSAIVGAAFGGVLFAALGAVALFFIDSISYLFASGVESTVTIPQTVPDKTGDVKEQLRNFFDEIVEGLRYVWRRPGLRNLVIVSALLGFFAAPIVLLLTFFVEDTLQVGVQWYGYMIAGYAVGSLVGYILAGVIPLPHNVRGVVLVIIILLNGITFGLLGVVESAVGALLILALNGLINGVFVVHLMTILQVTTPSDIRGRVFGLLAAISGSLSPIALGVTGFVVDWLDQDIPLIFIGSGVIMFTLSLLLVLSPSVRALLSYDYSLSEDQGHEQSLIQVDS